MHQLGLPTVIGSQDVKHGFKILGIVSEQRVRPCRIFRHYVDTFTYRILTQLEDCDVDSEKIEALVRKMFRNLAGGFEERLFLRVVVIVPSRYITSYCIRHTFNLNINILEYKAYGEGKRLLLTHGTFLSRLLAVSLLADGQFGQHTADIFLLGGMQSGQVDAQWLRGLCLV